MDQHYFLPELLNPKHLSTQLIEAQYRLKKSKGSENGRSLLVLVSGIELAGKGESVKKFREWVDPRYLTVKADPPHLLSEDQPFWQPYVNFIPEQGELAILFGNWYSDLLTTTMHVSQPLDAPLFDTYVENMRIFEQYLKDNQVEVVKIWFDLSRDSLQQRLDAMHPSERKWHKLHGLDWRNKQHYENIQKLRKRFTHDWIIIEGEDKKRRNQSFAQCLLEKLVTLPNITFKKEAFWPQADIPHELLHPLTEQMDKKYYKKKLKKLTRHVAQALRNEKRKVVIVFEGMDAAGKGGAIKRIIKRLDPREYDIFTIGVPEKYELYHPYLWRFWTKLKKSGDICIFDRSWYGRVLVERVEGFAQDIEWQRAYNEINHFEKELIESQTVIIKFWLSISKDEQEQRFTQREKTPHKQFKITEDDWRNRARWDDYLDSAADLLHHTHTPAAPWTVIATDDKYSARIDVLKAIIKRLKVN